ncbi:hypothetical protein OEZ85_001086 [Tetradesmus obliquus]|uniref:CFAP74 fourth Ig-like domain-containing protein n=1 Tax=Tetradesmus obliquus TaxID=3088 RepID=A0ABY8UMV8_TETOB|nr:hypothetical protein OEZ85_001086 [Tetradesmus obliquus]
MQRIQQLEQQIGSLQEEEQQLSAKVPLPVNRLIRVQQWLKERSAALEAEKAALDGKQMALLKTESQLRARETEADLLAEAAGSLSSAAARTAAAALRSAAAAHDAEVAAANKQLRQVQAAEQRAVQEEAAQQADAEQRIRAAQEGHAAAKRRLAASQGAIRATAEELAQAAAAEQERRRQALMSLKSKIDELRENVGQKADRFRQLQKQKRDQERREFEALQEQGLNPYEVYRLRDAEAAAAKAAAELSQQQAARMRGIAAVLDNEEKEYQKQLARQEFDRQVEEQYQREMGIAAQQQRTGAYMRSHTLSGQALLDPTSRLHPYPSDSILVKPAGFGLGRSSPEAVSKTSFGRTFAGDAFIAEPAELLFRDFVPGQVYRASLQLINRSFTKNSIRLLDVPAEVVDVIELDMPPSGCLAPGAAATLKVMFTPKAEADLSASIPLLAETGPLEVQLSCLARRALPSVQPCPVVCLNGRAGGVMLAATSSRSITISNAGALAVAYDVKVTGALAATSEYEEPDPPMPPPNATAEDMAELQAKACAATSLAVAGLRVQGIKGTVKGYSSIALPVEFTPRVAGDVEVPLLVRFAAPENRSLQLQPVQLSLTATGRELPVSTLTPLVDFKCVMFGRQYAAALLLANAGKSAMKALIGSRPELADWVTFTPDFGFIQAGDTLSVSVSLKPTPDMMHRLAKYLVAPGAAGSAAAAAAGGSAAEGAAAAAESVDGKDSDEAEAIFEVPLLVSVPGQTMPVPFKLRFQPTTTDLLLSPATLDFGRVPLSEQAGAYLSVTNPSRLPQTFSFGPKLPLGLSITPGGGYGSVLPGETLQLLMRFQPPIPGLQFLSMACRTLAGRVFKLQGKCEGLQLELELSHNNIKFPATAVGDAASASVILRNSSSSASQLFEFGVPAGSWMQSYWVLDFGALPVGERCTRQLLLSNTGPDVVPLSCSPLDPEGVFAIVNALRPVEGRGGSAKVLLAFAPHACKEYYEVLTIRSAKSRLRIALKGQGITPSLAISPAAATSSSGGLVFGDVLLSDPVHKELKQQQQQQQQQEEE